MNLTEPPVRGVPRAPVRRRIGLQRRTLPLGARTVPAPVVAPPARTISLTDAGVMVRFLLAHVALGVLVHFSGQAALIHFWATVAFGLWLASSTRRASDIALMAGYVVGAEVLWRMTRAALFWESGKYLVCLLLLIGLVRFPITRSMRAPVLYFVLLIPGVMVLSQNSVDVNFLRAQTSFYMSGPLALAVAACFFRQVTLTKNQLGEVMIAVAGPVMAIATMTLLSTYSADIVFRASSNFEASAGFGPNQVSAALSMGAVVCFLMLALQPDMGKGRVGILFGAMAVCSVQSAMTFSRGGIYMIVIALVGASLCLIADKAGRRIVFGSVFAVVLLYAFIAPRLVQYTGGAVAERFENADPSGRVQLFWGDLEVWADQPILGAGVGQAETRVLGRPDTRTHTEWTRMLADHGALGLVSMLVLLAIMAGNIYGARSSLERAVTTSLVLWSIAFLAVNDMRIAAPSFLVGLTCAMFQFPEALRQPVWQRRATSRLPLAIRS